MVVSERSPSTKATLGSNVAHVTVRDDERTGTVVAIGAIDNLVKGASGQADPVRQPARRAARDHRPAHRRGVPVSDRRGRRGDAGRPSLAHAHERAGVLVEALPYIRRFFGATVVVKYGGNAMIDPDLADRFAEDIVLLHSVGMRPVVVHGGGPQIGDLHGPPRQGVASSATAAGSPTPRRSTSPAWCWSARSTATSSRRSTSTGPLAVGLSGEDAGLITADRCATGDLGFVGDVTAVNPAIIERLLAENLIPVISTIGADEAGQAYNINADTVAGAWPRSSRPRRSSTSPTSPGCSRDVDDPDVADHPGLGARAARDSSTTGIIGGGMIPKIEACLAAVDGGVGSAHLLDGRLPHVLLLELFTDDGIGTMITRSIGAGA